MDELKTIFINFGTIFCGQKCIKYFNLDNDSKMTKIYSIKPVQCEMNNMGYERLKITLKQPVVPPHKSVSVKLSYLSYVEGVTDNMTYEILDSGKFLAMLNVHAQSIGPILSANSNNVTFYYFRDVVETVKHIELVNATKCDAKFQFDMDEDNEIIQISCPYGVVPASKKINIKLTFNTKECGIYYKQLFCLVQFHKPIIINVLAFYNPKLSVNPKSFIYKYPSDQKIDDTFQTYLETLNENSISEENVSLLQKCAVEYQINLNNWVKIDFDESNVNCNVASNSQPAANVKDEVMLTKHFANMKNKMENQKASTLCNLSKTRPYYYCWDIDAKRHFKITPSSGVIKPEKKINFIVHLIKTVPDQLFFSNIDLRVFPYGEDEDKMLNESIYLPLTTSLRIIGNSFPNDSSGWVPQCTIIPKVLQLPSCSPEKTAYNSFIIERQGHLPVVFQILLPENTNYRVQPRQGYISKTFQIIIVEFIGNVENGIYSENFKIIYNDSLMHCDTIKVTTLVESPKLIFGNDNSYNFKSTFPKSKSMAEIPVKNPTNFYLSYEFIIPEDINWLDIINPKGFVEPMSLFCIKAIFKPEEVGEYLDYIQCNVSLVSDPSKFIFQVMEFQLIGSCQFGFLVATPNIYDFGKCIYGMQQTTQIHVFNFSPVTLNFHLYAAQCMFPVGDIDADVTISPTKGIISGKSNAKIDIGIVPRNQDTYDYALFCQILEDDSEEAQPCDDPQKIFLFRFEGVLPTFQIIDLIIEDGGPLFSPHWIWKMLSISNVNEALNSLKPEQRIELRFPEAMIGSAPITIKLLVEAKKFGEVFWSLKKKTFCHCNDDVSEFYQSKKNCVHSKAVNWAPEKAKLLPKERLLMNIVLAYEHTDEFFVQWTWTLPYRRKIIFDSTVISLPQDEPTFASMYMPPIFHLKSVFLGDLDPPVQLFWLYNNTHQSTSYVVDKTALREVTSNIPKIFDCINASGVIPPFSCVPVNILFKPNEIIPYSAEFLLCVKENRPTKINLKGEGVLQLENFKYFSIEKTIPEKPILTNPNICLQCSINFVNIPYLQVFSETKKLFFLKNTSKVDSWAFHWHYFQVDKLLTAKIVPNQGVIEPGKIQTMTLVVKSLCRPGFISISIPYDVLNYSALKEYETAVKRKKETENKAADYFTITEKGTFYEIPQIHIPEKPKSSHLFLTVNVNTISRLNVDVKLLTKQQITLKAGVESIPEIQSMPDITQYMLPCIENVIEKVLWNILTSKIFKYQIKSQQEVLDYNYHQILRNIDRKNIEMFGQLASVINRNQMQRYLEVILKNIITRNFLTDSDQKI